MNESAHILRLLCTCQTENIALAETLATGLGIDILELLEREGFVELGIKTPSDFTTKLLKGDFIDKQITHLRAIKYFPRLTYLCCNNNKLTSLEGIQYLSNLKVLDCSNNQITNLNPLEYLPKLRSLDCANNQISDLDALKNLVHIYFLSFTNNQISNLNALQDLSNLLELFCCDNPISDEQLRVFEKRNPYCLIKY